MRRIALFFVITTISYGFADEAPQNTFAVVGQTAFLKCRAAIGSIISKWSFKRSTAEENASVIIFTTHGKQPTINCQRCSVAEDQNGFSVLSFNATMGDGGSYTCTIEQDQLEFHYAAEVIVSDRNSQCELKTSYKPISGVINEGNYLEILCNFSFAGNMTPVIRWIRNCHNISLPLHQADNYVDGIHWFHFNTTFQLNASDNGMVFGYEVDFERSNSAESTQLRFNRATNALSNVFRWNFTAVMPKNIRIEPMKKIYNFGDRIECLADGNPSPNFTWSCDVGMKRAGGSVLTLENDTFKFDVNYTCQCTAMSSIFSRNISGTIVIKIAHGIGNAHETEWTNRELLISIGVLSSIIAAVIFAILMALHFKAAADRPTSNESTEIPTYAEVRKPLTGSPASKAEKRRPGATAKVDQDDAVIYLDLKGGKSKLGKSPPAAVPPMSQTAMFNQSEYAAINHALQPPPLKKRNN